MTTPAALDPTSVANAGAARRGAADRHGDHTVTNAAATNAQEVRSRFTAMAEDWAMTPRAVLASAVGRKRELAAVARLLAAASGGHGGLMVVTGPPGSGRTAMNGMVVRDPLVDEASQVATRVTIADGLIVRLQQYRTRDEALAAAAPGPAEGEH
jgi:hypothetical protein